MHVIHNYTKEPVNDAADRHDDAVQDNMQQAQRTYCTPEQERPRLFSLHWRRTRLLPCCSNLLLYEEAMMGLLRNHLARALQLHLPVCNQRSTQTDRSDMKRGQASSTGR